MIQFTAFSWGPASQGRSSVSKVRVTQRFQQPTRGNYLRAQLISLAFNE